MFRIWIGIDPGLSGAVAALDEQGKIITVQDVPVLTVKKAKGHKRVYVESQMATILESIKASAPGGRDSLIVFLESVHAMPGQGVTSMFSMGTGLGIWLGILAALRIPYERVEPAKWKREMGIASGSDKSASIVRASQLFPTASLSRKKDDGRADALLLAEWGRRKMTGKT